MFSRDVNTLTFQTFADNKDQQDRKLSKVIQGLTEDNIRLLVKLNEQGAGVFIMVNKGDGEGRKAQNVIKVNAIFVDLDGAPLQPVLDFRLKPHIIVESSPDRFHAYWLVDDCPLERFKSLQLALSNRFDGDEKVNDLCRVMRVPGFLHKKGNPFTTHILSIDAQLPHYSVSDFDDILELPFDTEPTKIQHPSVKEVITEGRRNDTLFKIACSLSKTLSVNSVLAAIIEENNTRCDPPLSEDEVTQIVSSAQKYDYSEKEIGESSKLIKQPPKFNMDSLPGLLGEFVKAACHMSEADPAAVAATFLVRFGIECGPDPCVMVGDTGHSARLNAVIVGDSSKSRKGTSAGPVKAFFQGIGDCKTSPGPLSTGEGIIYAVRDEQKEWKIDSKTKKGEWIVSDPGIEDKRLFVLDGEFANALAATRREGNTLSSILRCLYDDGNAEPLTKNNRTKTTNAHVGIVTHITLFELKKLLTENEQLNGFGNRFLWVHASRNGVVPFPEPMDANVKSSLREKVAERLKLAQAGGIYELSPEARELYLEVYPTLSKAHHGIAGCMVNRAEAIVRRLSLIFACLEGHTEIERSDLDAAMVFWQYCKDSALYIFGSNPADRKEMKILNALNEKSDHQMSKNKIRKEVFDNHITSERLGCIIEEMVKGQLVEVIKEQTDGAPRTVVSLK
jgi:hypothetical protein